MVQHQTFPHQIVQLEIMQNDNSATLISAILKDAT